MRGGGSSCVGIALVQLIPLVIGSVMMPTWILLVLFLLRQRDGQVTAIAFVGGVTAVRLLQGIIFGLFISAYHFDAKRGQSGTLVSTLLIIVGIIMWVTALTLILRTDDGADDTLPLWQRMINAITPLKAFGLGALLVLTSSRAWVFTLTALGIIGRAELSAGESLVAFLLFVLGAEILLVAPILVSMWSSTRFGDMAYWLEKHERPIMIVASFIVGGYFLWQGGTGLLG